MKPGASQSKADGLESPPASADLKTRLIAGSQDCIKVLDLDGRLLSMNAGGMAVLEICDLTPFIGSSWIDFWQGADREAARAAVKTARDRKVLARREKCAARLRARQSWGYNLPSSSSTADHLMTPWSNSLVSPDKFFSERYSHEVFPPFHYITVACILPRTRGVVCKAIQR